MGFSMKIVPGYGFARPALLNMKGRTDELGCLALGDEASLLEVA